MFQSDASNYSLIFWMNNSAFWEVYLFDNYDNIGKGWFYYWALPRALFMCKVTTFFNLITLNNIYLNAVYFSLINLLSLFYLVSAISEKYELQKIASFVLLIIPSIVFNTSGLEKETLVLAGFYFIVGAFQNFNTKGFSMKRVFFLLFGLFLVLKIKSYYLAVIIPLYLLFDLFKYLKSSPRLSVFFGSVLIVFFLFMDKMNSILTIEKVFEWTSRSNKIIVQNSSEGMGIPFNFEDYTVLEFILNSPKALLYGLFGPFIWEAQNLPMLYIGIENLVILFLAIIFLVNLFKGKVELNLFWKISILYIMFLATILSLYSPNFGTLTRYKVSFLPLLVVFLLNFTFKDQINNFKFNKYFFK